MKYEDQLAAARYRAERDQARQELDRLRDEMEAMRPCLMPEGCEWPRYESGELVGFGDEASRLGEDFEIHVICLYSNGSYALNFCPYLKGERVKRPAPKALDADGVETRLNDKVYDQDGTEWRVNCIPEPGDPSKIQLRRSVKPQGSRFVAVDPKTLTHRAPVIAADGRPLREGETVWSVDSGTKLVVKKLPKPGEYQAVIVFALPTSPASHLTSFDPDQLTHERSDSWERLEEDAGKNPFDYCKDVGHRLDTCENSEAYKARDLVRRCKALAGVSE